MVSDSSCTLFPGIVLRAAYNMQRSVTFLLASIHLLLPLFSSSLDLVTDFNCPMGRFSSLCLSFLLQLGPSRALLELGTPMLLESCVNYFLAGEHFSFCNVK